MNERKALTLELKAEAEGEFRAVFSTLNVIDKDGDITRPGAFEPGAPVRIAQWGHNWGALPVGKGAIGADSTKAWVDGSFFLDTQAGMDTYKTVKALADLQEWSYGFEVTKSSNGNEGGKPVRILEAVKVFEVSPVMLGAGIGTHTEGIKGHLTLEDESEAALAAATRFVERVKSLAELRAKEGRTLSQSNRDRLKRHLQTLADMRDELETLLNETEPKAANALRAEFLKFQRLIAPI